MTSDAAVSLESLYDLHKEWEALVAHREAVRAAPYDPDAEADLVLRLERHHARLTAMREAILRQAMEEDTENPSPDAGSPAAH